VYGPPSNTWNCSVIWSSSTTMFKKTNLWWSIHWCVISRILPRG
jgi:hypothetical protein